jgi:hypothetical protein
MTAKLVFFTLLTVLVSVAVLAEPSRSTALNFTVSSIPEAKFGIKTNFTFPFLQGNSFLTENNNISIDLGAEISPVSLNGLTELVWTPVAFFQVVSGGRIGSGWNMRLFGANIYGIGINRRRPDGTTEIDGTGFNGLLWSLKGGAVLQFDMAALFPGDWRHVVFHSYHEINYAAYTAAGSGDSWFFENDLGENRNGFNYYGNYLIGYQMPIFLNMVGLMAEMNKYLYNTPGGELWGDSLARWTFSLLCNFTISDKWSAALLTQFRTMRNFTPGTKDADFYQDRRMSDSFSRRLEFYRVAAVMTLKLK